MNMDKLHFFTDIFTVFRLRIKMIFKSLPVLVAFFISIVITGILVNSLLESAEEKSSIPIGIVDMDNTQTSNDVSSFISNLDAVYVYNDSYENLINKMENHDIEVIIKINKNFSELLKKSSRKDKLMTIYYPKGYHNMTLVSDIVLSQVMDEICYNACLRAYQKFEKTDKIITEEEYKEKNDIIHDKNKDLVNFNFEIINIEKEEDVTDNITNGLIYRLVLIGIITLLISFIILFASNTIISDKTYNTENRIRISLMGVIAKSTGDLLALFFTGELYVIFSFFQLFEKLQIRGFNNALAIFLTFSLFNLVMCMFFIILTNFINEAVMLQISGAFLVCFSGITGSLEIISLILSDFLKMLTKISPNVYVIKIYNKMTITGDISNEKNIFLIYSLIITVVFYIIIVANYFYKRRFKS